MEVKSILLCDAATPHPDGTFSLLRGGVDQWNVKSFPTQITFSFVVILELLSTEIGRTHTAELDVIDADGNRVLPQGKIPFSIPTRMNVTRYKINLAGSLTIPVEKAGKFSFQLGVDGYNLSSTEFQAVQALQQPSQI